MGREDILKGHEERYFSKVAKSPARWRSYANIGTDESLSIFGRFKAMTTRPLLIGGEWRTAVPTKEGGRPFNSELLANFCVATETEVEESIASSTRAAIEMRELPRHRIAESLRLIADGIDARPEDFART